MTESYCIFTGLIYFWTAIAPEQTDLPFRKHLEAITIWASTIEKKNIHSCTTQPGKIIVLPSSSSRLFSFGSLKTVKTVFYTRKQETISSKKASW